MGLKAGWIALFLFVWIIGAFLGSTFEYQDTTDAAGQAYTEGDAAFTYNSATVTGVATTWVADMEDGIIKNNNDDLWYKIDTVVNNTQLILTAVYAGTGGVAAPYTMAASAGWAGTGTGGYSQSPVTTLSYLADFSNVISRTQMLGIIPLPTPNGEYFDAVGKVITWRWSFVEDYDMLYWILFFPFVAMGVLAVIVIVFNVIAGNLPFT